MLRGQALIEMHYVGSIMARISHPLQFCTTEPLLTSCFYINKAIVHFAHIQRWEFIKRLGCNGHKELSLHIRTPTSSPLLPQMCHIVFVYRPMLPARGGKSLNWWICSFSWIVALPCPIVPDDSTSNVLPWLDDAAVKTTY